MLRPEYRIRQELARLAMYENDKNLSRLHLCEVDTAIANLRWVLGWHPISTSQMLGRLGLKPTRPKNRRNATARHTKLRLNKLAAKRDGKLRRASQLEHG